MQKTLVPIFQLRELCLQKLNSTLFNKEFEIIHNSALAAQDYILSGRFTTEYNPRMGMAFKRLPGYIAVHQKYNLPYNPDTTTPNTTRLNPGLVMDLAHAYHDDIINGIIDRQGNIRNISRLPQSEVMAVYHNSAIYGTPANAFQLMTSTQFQKMLTQSVQQHTR